MTDECDSSYVFKSRVKIEPDENDAAAPKIAPILHAPIVVQRVSKAVSCVPRVVSVARARTQSPKKIEKIALNLKAQQEKRQQERKSSRGVTECRRVLYSNLSGRVSCPQDDSLLNLDWLSTFDLMSTGLAPLSPPLSPTQHDETDSCFHRLTINRPLHHDATTKPPYTFSCLIFLAIESSCNKRLCVKEINQWIVDNIAYYKNVPSGSWKNSIRFNLSSNQCFSKVDKNLLTMRDFSGKGSLWCINPIYRPMLLESLARIGPNYEKLNSIACLKDTCESPRSDMNSRASRISQSKPAVLNPKLKNLSKSSNQRSYSVAKNESNVCSDMDAVNALLSMKSRASSMPAASKGRRKQLLKPPTKRTEDDDDSDDLVDELDTSDYDFEARDEDSADESMLHIDESVCESEDGSEKRKFDDADDDDDDQISETRKKSKNESQMNPLLELSRAALIVEDQN